MARAKGPPQSFISSYAPRLRIYSNSLLTPAPVPAATLAAPLSRITKRGTIALNYAEDGYDDYDEEEDERRRPTGLRTVQKNDLGQAKHDAADRVGRETTKPVEVQGIWRDWMGKTPTSKPDLQKYAQAAMPLTLIPIRIDLEIPSFTPPPPLPPPTGGAYQNIDVTLPVYRTPEATVPYKLHDTFLWNLHECLTTTDQFAQAMVQDLDLPNRGSTAIEISKQIRTQLEEYAGVALHPLFHSPAAARANGTAAQTVLGSSRDASATPMVSGAGTPMRNARPATPSRNARLGTPLRTNGPQTNGFATPTKAPSSRIPTESSQEVTATAEPTLSESDEYNPDDAYRCIITLSINLSNNLYTDKFEWSLLHPPGTAEVFAKQTCADLGLNGEWVSAMTHAIYEAVLRLKKEACESGGLTGGHGARGDVANEAAHGTEAGWRYDPEHLADAWEPKIEALSKEEIEKREGDRERQIRRLRRETARFSSTSLMNGGGGGGAPSAAASSFEHTPGGDEERMGRGERSKKKRRFRSLSPLARGGTPGGRGTPDTNTNGLGAGYGGGGAGGLNEYERLAWRCAHCKVWGSSVWAVRDGPAGPRSLCNNCGFMYERDRKLPPWSKDLHRSAMRAVDYR